MNEDNECRARGVRAIDLRCLAISHGQHFGQPASVDARLRDAAIASRFIVLLS